MIAQNIESASSVEKDIMIIQIKYQKYFFRFNLLFCYIKRLYYYIHTGRNTGHLIKWPALALYTP